MLCQVFKSSRRQETYLYVAKSDGLERVPAALLADFGEPQQVLMVMLDGQRRLARADAGKVLLEIESRGYYLQMPPGPGDLRRRES